MSTAEQGSDPGSTRPKWRIPLVVGIALAGILALVLLGRLVADAISGEPAIQVEAGLAVEVTVPVGASARSIAASLEEAGVVTAREFEEAVARQGAAGQLQAGTYALETVMEPEEALASILAGPNAASDSSVIVVEGLRVSEIIEDLAAQTGRPAATFEEALRNDEVTSPFLPEPTTEGVDDLNRWEGLLFPARYEVPEGASPAEILKMMADEMVRRMEGVDWSRLEALGVSRYEALIIASLIQREAGVDDERATIASVIYNRLEEGIPLQIDATVIYALDENPGRVRAEHLEVDSPWNTYRIEGLPPTPIGTVQLESLEAAANPEATEFRFYVLISEDGRHGFSVTYEEHQAKVEQAKADGVLP